MAEGVREAGVGAADLLGHVGVQLREPLDVHLVDHGLLERYARRRVVAPFEAGVGDDAERHGPRRVGVVALLWLVHVVAEHCLRPGVLALDRRGVRVQE